jgi:hypothetical protein
LSILTDHSEDEDLRLLGLVMLAEVEIEEQQRAYELRLLAMAGCTQAEARAAMRGEHAAN